MYIFIAMFHAKWEYKRLITLVNGYNGFVFLKDSEKKVEVLLWLGQSPRLSCFKRKGVLPNSLLM